MGEVRKSRSSGCFSDFLPGDASPDSACDGSDLDSEPDSDVDMLCCHRVQDSLLSSASRFTDYRGILNWIIILLVLTHAHLFLENFIQHGFLIDLWKVLVHLIQDDWPSVYLVMAANVFAVAALLLEKCQDKGQIPAGVGHCLHLLNLVVLMLFPSAVILQQETCLSTGGALFSLCIYTVLGLKLYSYQEANRWYRQEHCRAPGITCCISQESGERTDHLTLGDLYYFLLAPTLCYQRGFPQTPSIRLNFLLHRLLEMVVLTQLMVGIVQQWISPLFQRTNSTFTNMDVTTRIEHLVELVAPNHFLWLILFFLFCHSCLNFSGELLRFGDRHFYGDWWNADTLKSFWRKLSVLFHKWSDRHLYTPMVRGGVPPREAELLAFLFSAALCEYVIAVPLRTCRLWIFLIMILELLVAVFLGRYFTGNYGNGLVWLCVLMGPPMAVMTYFHDHYITYRAQPHWTLY
ncbi:diacylglycerol O-acyltransferase 1-like [Anguilla anguilla]|uniref:diacylglycerol O-acyltransferase 1-like n=1 Tax=Anguilla anguilla TaxID=7936 RepID=UPI0015AB3902|nr:diacylglycerol O-acyltransferase 1-like [Anguilla anguilla]XP_035251856.1 diacylglycerol O-acyltransferase 1-like [Anguilla anguilla]XP_035251857.1 diacylglycerol O-acyltransferase 1-like [Anguilla anguilla]XP_035251858.1 diacylglycerol O-acyltransferase 1-like [Anguilla anguilla]XP_035251859.1 diacylglycerol O-acyltransferase 1-like [Anguilla anguilla]